MHAGSMTLEHPPGHAPHLTALLSVREVAALLGVHRNTVHRLVSSGQLCSVRVGRLPRFRREEIDTYLNRS